MTRFSLVSCPICVWILAAPLAAAQPSPDTSIAAALRSLTDRAGSVFAGEVTAIRPLGGVVEVEFHVSQTFKGQPTATVTLREWAGLWATGERRYWLGERAVVFLHPPGKSGLSSSVDGMEGILPLLPDPASATTLSADIERLRTRVLRAVGEPLVASNGPMSLSELASAIRGEATPAPLPPVVPDPSPPVSQPDPQPVRLPIPVHGSPVLPTPPHPTSDPAPLRTPQGKPLRLPRYRDATL